MRNERKNGIRQTIIDTAGRLFYQQGYVNTGINQILEESGVVKSSLYVTFRSKEEILMEYLVSAGAGTDKALYDAAHQFTDPKEQVLAVFDYLLKIVQESDYFGCSFLNIISEVPRAPKKWSTRSECRRTESENSFPLCSRQSEKKPWQTRSIFYSTEP
ncbi:TetR/AcrR family transcriptional regulator [Puia sp. P3]|uniref:TetR/AcrR family transcriptional regulator n=1 Tax=Puia sp. P3 TaxID=3423952 RepID=UPI003D67B673